MRLFDFLDKAAESQPDAAAVVQGETALTYGELVTLSRKFAHAVDATPLADGEVVATWMPNDRWFFVCQFGIHRTRKLWMPLNPRATAAEAIDVMMGFEARWLIIHSVFAKHIDEIRATVPSLAGIILVDRPMMGFPSLEDWIAPHAETCPDPDIGPLDCVTLLTTGGSTGRPKGVMRTSLNWATMITNYRLATPARGKPVDLAVTPLTHVAGDVALSVIAQKGTVFLCADTKPASILEAIRTHNVTVMFLPPTLIYGLLAEPGVRDCDYSSLQYLLYGAAPMSLTKLDEAWDVFGPVMTQIYGLMEITSTAAMMPPAEHAAARGENRQRLASCGRGSPSVMIEIVDEDGKRLAPGEKGEVVLRGNALMKGYHGNPDATAAAIRSGWFRTGDIGYKDSQGYLYLVDRSKDIIISGGFNIFPGEVEQVVWRHPAVQDCAVVGLPDDKWGEVVTAVVELKPGGTLVEGELIELCKQELGSIRAPKRIIVWDRLPRSNVGKVLKKDVRAHFWRESGRTI